MTTERLGYCNVLIDLTNIMSRDLMSRLLDPRTVVVAGVVVPEHARCEAAFIIGAIDATVQVHSIVLEIILGTQEENLPRCGALYEQLALHPADQLLIGDITGRQTIDSLKGRCGSDLFCNRHNEPRID